MNEEQLQTFFHDLKNDLASMAALCNLHRLYANEAGIDEVLDNLTVRQMIISTAYERLYREADYPYINLKIFIAELLEKEKQYFTTWTSAVRIEKKVEDIKLPIKKATPIAQVLVELLYNSYKHAFNEPGIDKIIEFSILNCDSDHLLFEYSDSGSGLPESVDPQRAQSLGMQLITSISKQLGDPIRHTDESGRTKFSFKIKI